MVSERESGGPSWVMNTTGCLVRSETGQGGRSLGRIPNFCWHINFLATHLVEINCLFFLIRRLNLDTVKNCVPFVFCQFLHKRDKIWGKTDESAQYMFQRLFLSFKPFAPHPKTPTGQYVRMRWSVCSNVYWFEPRGWYMRNGAQVQVTGD